MLEQNYDKEKEMEEKITTVEEKGVPSSSITNYCYCDFKLEMCYFLW